MGRQLGNAQQNIAQRNNENARLVVRLAKVFATCACSLCESIVTPLTWTVTLWPLRKPVEGAGIMVALTSLLPER